MTTALSEPTRPIEYPGFWKRLLAAIIDLLVLLVIIVPVELAIFGMDYLELALSGQTLSVDIWVQLILPLAALVLFWRYTNATPGLFAISAKIVDAGTIGSVSPGRLLVRAICLAVMLILIVPLGIGLLWIAFDSRKQGWHDKIARTLVVYDDE